jgi:hypothetical protein
MAAYNTAQFGYSAYMGVAPETSYGTFQTSTVFCEFLSEGFKKEIKEKYLETINTTRNVRTRMQMEEEVSGSVEAPLNNASDAINWMIINAMGGTVGSAIIGATIGYTHTINEGDLTNNAASATAKNLAGLSFVVRKGADNGLKWQYQGMKVNTLSIKGEIGSEVMMSAELIGKTASICAAAYTVTTVSLPEIVPCNFTGITIQTGDTSTTLSTTSYTGFEFTINNNLISDGNARVLGSRSLALCPAGMREVTLKLNNRFDTTSTFSLGDANAPKYFTINLDSGQTIAAAATTYSMLITLPRCYYAPNNPAVGGPDIIMEEATLRAVMDTTTSYAVQMKIFNATTSYALA